ncbi:MAG: hypothetical protein EBW88_07410, partial [Betaproteobacteria bacterium]|nr:hypothetical protein [Betaproteobacteria bacterium]
MVCLVDFLGGHAASTLCFQGSRRPAAFGPGRISRKNQGGDLTCFSACRTNGFGPVSADLASVSAMNLKQADALRIAEDARSSWQERA